MRRLILAALYFLILRSVMAQAQEPPLGDATVRLFSTAPVRGLTIESTGHPLQHVTAKDLNHRLVLAGQLKITTDDGRSATAAGRWSIASIVDGLHVVVTLPGERYVMAVLATEASTDTQAESLKALAVAARSFGLANGHRHGNEGLCDSTHCQAMHLAADVPDRIRDAVLATAGETIWFATAHGDRRVSAPFTQSCGGESASGTSVWGGAAQPWLPVHADPYCQRQSSAWRTAVSAVDLLSALVAEGQKVPPTLEDLRIVQRVEPNNPNSRARRLELKGGGRTLQLDAATLRFAIDRSQGWNTLRSDWYNVQVVHGHVVFLGKGFGHGVGLCQAGASEMARQGRTYREILGFYYPGTTVRIAGKDAGWQTRSARGWTLRTTSHVASLLQQGDTALARARALLPFDISPVVTLYPTTELFRQATAEPGWVLGTTKGSSVALQPMEVLARHGGAQPLLLHEFLHVAVEQRASAKAPLWLREGLVEFLAREAAPAHAAATGSTMQIDAALLRSTSLAEGQRAHALAEAQVRLLVQQHGLGVVIGWLRSGVPGDVGLR